MATEANRPDPNPKPPRSPAGTIAWGVVALIVVGLLAWFGSIASNMKETVSRMQVSSSLKQIGVGLHSYADSTEDGRLPGANAPAEEPKGAGQKHPVSWRVLILRHIEQEELFNQYRFGEPWDGPNNIQLLERMPKIYRHPKADEAHVPFGHTHYRVFACRRDAKPSALFTDGVPGPKLPGTPDGTSNTILIVEAAEAVPWTMPEVLLYDNNQPLPKLGGLLKGQFQVALADGSIRPFRNDFPELELRAWITKDGGEPLDRE